MDIHVLGKAGASGVPTAFRTDHGGIFSGYHMRAMPPQMKGFDSFPTEVMFGLPANDIMVGSFWRSYRGNPAFESQTRNEYHPGPQVGAFSPMGNMTMPTERTEMEAPQGIVIPG